MKRQVRRGDQHRRRAWRPCCHRQAIAVAVSTPLQLDTGTRKALWCGPSASSLPFLAHLHAREQRINCIAGRAAKGAANSDPTAHLHKRGSMAGGSCWRCTPEHSFQGCSGAEWAPAALNTHASGVASPPTQQPKEREVRHLTSATNTAGVDCVTHPATPKHRRSSTSPAPQTRRGSRPAASAPPGRPLSASPNPAASRHSAATAPAAGGMGGWGLLRGFTGKGL